MKMKKIVLSAITVIIAGSFITTSAWAGSRQRHRWEGVAIGVGAAIVGSAIVTSVTHGSHVAPPVSVSVNYVEYEQPPAHSRHHYQTHRHNRCCERHVHKHGCRKACRHSRYHGRDHHHRH